MDRYSYKSFFWKIVSKDNITGFYGRSESSRIANPDDSTQIFEWLIDESYDAKGNKILYTYKAENNENVPGTIVEVNRSYTANRYIQHIQYGNYFDEQNKEQFAFKIIFDYGEYDITNPLKAYMPAGNWLYRTDPFSSYKSGLRSGRAAYAGTFYYFINSKKN
ncbi:MAG: SpvB/TcaC N-terminal domain-containing protein [Bacteroidota bacterium]